MSFPFIGGWIKKNKVVKKIEKEGAFEELTHKDSNLERRYQKPLCYQLHHGSIYAFWKRLQIYNKKSIL